MKILLFFLPLFATEPVAPDTQLTLMKDVKIAELSTQVSAAKYREAERVMKEAEAENIKANGEFIAGKLKLCKAVGGTVLDDCTYDFIAWKITKKPAKEPK